MRHKEALKAMIYPAFLSWTKKYSLASTEMLSRNNITFFYFTIFFTNLCLKDPHSKLITAQNVCGQI